MLVQVHRDLDGQFLGLFLDLVNMNPLEVNVGQGALNLLGKFHPFLLNAVLCALHGESVDDETLRVVLSVFVRDVDLELKLEFLQTPAIGLSHELPCCC